VSRSRRLLALACAATALLAATNAYASPAKSVKEHVDLKLVKKSGGSKFQHSGRATGTFVGTVKSKITIEHSVVLRGTVTISTSGGAVRMKVDGRARSLSLRTKFNGTATITGGTGRYAHAKGTGRFSGVVNRSSWHATLDATGSFTS
jgi:hypothetical protein